MTPKGQHDSDTALPGKCIIHLLSSSEPSIFRSTFQPARTPDPETTPFLARLFKGTVKRDLRCKTWLQRCQSYPTHHRRKSAYFCAANARLSVGRRPYSKVLNSVDDSKQTRVGKQQKHRYEAHRVQHPCHGFWICLMLCKGTLSLTIQAPYRLTPSYISLRNIFYIFSLLQSITYLIV